MLDSCAFSLQEILTVAQLSPCLVSLARPGDPSRALVPLWDFSVRVLRALELSRLFFWSGILGLILRTALVALFVIWAAYIRSLRETTDWLTSLALNEPPIRTLSQTRLKGQLILMFEMRHDIAYEDPRNYGRIVYMASCRIH